MNIRGMKSEKEALARVLCSIGKLELDRWCQYYWICNVCGTHVSEKGPLLSSLPRQVINHISAQWGCKYRNFDGREFSSFWSIVTLVRTYNMLETLEREISSVIFSLLLIPKFNYANLEKARKQCLIDADNDIIVTSIAAYNNIPVMCALCKMQYVGAPSEEIVLAHISKCSKIVRS